MLSNTEIKKRFFNHFRNIFWLFFWHQSYLSLTFLSVSESFCFSLWTSLFCVQSWGLCMLRLAFNFFNTLTLNVCLWEEHLVTWGDLFLLHVESGVKEDSERLRNNERSNHRGCIPSIFPTLHSVEIWLKSTHSVCVSLWRVCTKSLPANRSSVRFTAPLCSKNTNLFCLGFVKVNEDG